MSDLITQIQTGIKNLHKALASDNKPDIHRQVTNLFELLIENETYLTIGNELLIAQAEQQLAHYFESKADEDLMDLREYLTHLHEIHQKLYAVLDSSIDLERLLSRELTDWSTLSIKLDHIFDDELKNKLHQSRVAGDSEQKLKLFFDFFLAELDKHGLDEDYNLHHAIDKAIEGYRNLHDLDVYGLFTIGTSGDTYGIKVNMQGQGAGEIKAINTVGHEMASAANRALTYAQSLHTNMKKWDFTWEISRYDIPFEGESIGLAIAIALLMKMEKFDVDRYTAFTGCIDVEGNIKRVEGVNEKLRAAFKLGLRRVFIPYENQEEADNIIGLKVISVQTIQQTLEYIKEDGSYKREHSNFRGVAEDKIRQLETALKSQHIIKESQSDAPNSAIRLEFTDRRNSVILMVYYASQITPLLQGKDTDLRNIVANMCNEIFGEKIPKTQIRDSQPKTTKYIVKDAVLQKKLHEILKNRDDSIQESEANCLYRMKITLSGEKIFVRQFINGTLTVNGKPPVIDEIDSFVRAIIGVSDSAISKNDQHSRSEKYIEAVEAIELGDYWIGTDEAGKGDYYGPLVVGGVLLTKELASELEKMGIKDSKTLSDNRNIELAEQIHKICGNRARTVIIPPERYNSLYSEFQREGKNLNTLLAWGHTRVLEDILTQYPQKQITVIIDKFGDEHYVKSKLLSNSRQTNLNLIQLPKAEANIAVACASILARAQFLISLKQMADQYHINFPKGASDPRIISVGQEIIRQHGINKLHSVAKVHFATTQKIKS